MQLDDLQIVTGIAPVASLVNWVGGEVTYVYGGCVFALANRVDISSLKDLVNMKVIASTRSWWLLACMRRHFAASVHRLPNTPLQMSLVAFTCVGGVIQAHLAYYQRATAHSPQHRLPAF